MRGTAQSKARFLRESLRRRSGRRVERYALRLLVDTHSIVQKSEVSGKGANEKVINRKTAQNQHSRQKLS